MPRQKSEKRERAFQIWWESGGKTRLKDIAADLDIGETQVRKWKCQDKWGERVKVTLPNPKPRMKGNVTKTRGPKRERHIASRRVGEDDTRSLDLTPKQVIFVAEYLIDFNATRAAMAAGYSKKTAAQLGYQLLHKPSIQAEIKRQTALVMEHLGITSQRVLLEYLKVAFADITNFVEFGQKEVQVMGAFGPVKDEEGTPLTKTVSYVSFKESAEVDGTLISEVKQGKEGIGIKLHDKMKALEKLEKYLDLLPDRHKRMIEEAKLELEREQLKAKLGDDDSAEDDGFLEALKGEASEVWSDEET